MKFLERITPPSYHFGRMSYNLWDLVDVAQQQSAGLWTQRSRGQHPSSTHSLDKKMFHITIAVMVIASNRKELIGATMAFVSRPGEVSMAGGVRLPLADFENEASTFIGLGAVDEKAAADAVANHVRTSIKVLTAQR